MKEYYITNIENINAPKVVKFRKIFFRIWIAVTLVYAAFALINYNFPLGINEDFLYYVSLVINPGNLLFWGLFIVFDYYFISNRPPFIKFDGETFSIRKNAISKVFAIKISAIKDIRLQAVTLIIHDINNRNHEFTLGEYSYSQIQKAKELIGVIKSRNASETIIKTSDSVINN